jgi:hypothetical protein
MGNQYVSSVGDDFCFLHPILRFRVSFEMA